MPQTGIQEGLLVGHRAPRGVAPWLQGTLVALLVAASFGAITVAIYLSAQSALINEIHSGLLRTAAIALRSVDVDAHQQLQSPSDHGTPAYDALAGPLRDIVLADPLVAFVGTAIERDGRVYFVLDGTPKPAPGEPWPDTAVQVLDEYEDPPADLLVALREGRAMVSKPYTDEWGSFISAFQPLRDAAGRTIAVFFIDLKVTEFEKRLQPIRTASLVAGAIGVLIAVLMGLGVWFNRKTDRTARELARQLRTVNALLAVSRALGSGVNLGDLLPVIIKQTKAVMAAEHCALFLLDERPGRLRRTTGAATDSDPLPITGIVGRVVASRRTASVADARSDPDFDPAIDQREGSVTRSMLAQPIIDNAGKLVGVMQVANKIGEPAFDEDDQILLGALGAQVMTALDRARLTQVYVEKQKLDEALKLAASIQMSMLSRSFPVPGQDAVEVHACLVPAKEVGGDFYDFFRIDRTTLAFLVADVSGKGMPAALFMAKAKTLIKAHASLVRDPQEILRRANDELAEDNDNGMFVTLFLGVLDTVSGRVRMANAGHNPTYLLPAAGGPPERLPTPADIALGVMEGMPYSVSELQLRRGDILFLYTDGVNEAMNRVDEQFDYDRMEAVLAEPHPSVVDLNDAMLAAVREFATGAEQSDDLTILSVRWRGEDGPTP
jgi:serine phosphatase RsbU (regulator of sigma subunit)